MTDINKLMDLVEARREECLSRMRQYPVAVLIWGPSPASGTPQADTRLALRDALTKEGHLANFSEDLVDPTSSYSIVAQEYSHLDAHDIAFSIPSSPGSVAEAHDFSRLPLAPNKLVTYINQDWNDGYSSRSLTDLQSPATASIEIYQPTDLPTAIIDHALDLVRRLQELYYMYGRRI